MIEELGVIAQLVEHCNGIAGVSGSNPLSSIVSLSDSQKILTNADCNAETKHRRLG